LACFLEIGASWYFAGQLPSYSEVP